MELYGTEKEDQASIHRQYFSEYIHFWLKAFSIKGNTEYPHLSLAILCAVLLYNVYIQKAEHGKKTVTEPHKTTHI